MATTTDAPTAEELDEARDRVREELSDEERDQRRHAHLTPQLSFDLGTGRGDSPDFATVKVGGQLGVERNLRYAEPVTVTITNRHGEVIAEASATIGYPAFKDHFDKYGTKTVERIHTATVD